MKPPRRALLPALAAALLAALAQPAPAQQKLQLEDRVVAVVDEDPILASDIDRLIGLGLAERRQGEDDRDFRRRVLGELIEQRLRFHEIDRFGFEQVPVEEIERQVAEIRGRFPGEEVFRQALKDLGLTLENLRQLVARQLMVLTYVDERLGPRVFVSLEDIQKYYDDTLAPEMRRRGAPVPPLDEVREDIRAVLKEQRLNQEIERWTEELRDRADVANYFEEGGKPLPPVVRRIGAKPKTPGS